MAVLLLLVAACQPLPRPFRPDAKPAGLAGLAGIADKVGVFVAGIDQAPPALDQAVRTGLARRLGELDIAASATTANRHSFLLTCSVVGGAAPVLAWRLIDADGVLVGLVDQRLPGGRAAWEAGEAALAARIVAEAAPRLAAMIRDRAPPPPLPPPPVVVLAPIEGAPGDGAEALAVALRGLLAAAGVEVREAGADALVVAGKVTLSRGGETDHVALRWVVRDAAGSELGVVDQANRIPRGSLDGAWGETAEAVAYGAAEGILAILAQAR